MRRAGKLSLLIVEDDANTRFLTETAAQRTGLFEPITTAEDGLAALQTLQAAEAPNRPALVLSDLSMPHMTGLELLRAIKADAALRSIPVAIITSSDVPNDRELALSAGACAFVSKPCGIDALIRVLAQLREVCDAVTTANA